MLQIRSHSTSMFSSAREPLRRLARQLRACRASFAASRWRWSSSCSAVSTTEVTIPGLQTTPPEVHTAPSPTSRAMSRIVERELRRAGERVAALVHRRRAGVRGLAAPRDARALDAERAEHDAEREVQRLEHRALLDVQLEVGGRVRELRARLERAVEVDAVLAQRVGQRDPVAVGQLSQLVLVAHRARRRRRAEERAAEARALLVGPVDEPHRHRRRRPPRRSGASTSTPATHVQAAVEPAAVRHRVDVPADQQRAAPSARASVNHWFPASSISSTRAGRPRPSRAATRARVSHVSVHATRWAPFSSPVSSRSSSSSATVRDGIERHAARPTTARNRRR